MNADAPAAPPKKWVMVKRHGLLVRLNHWVNVIALTLLLMSGAGIFNAHPNLDWGKASTFDDPWLSIGAAYKGQEMRGFIQLGSAKVDTTGVFGASGPKDARSRTPTCASSSRGALRARATTRSRRSPIRAWCSFCCRWSR